MDEDDEYRLFVFYYENQWDRYFVDPTDRSFVVGVSKTDPLDTFWGGITEDFQEKSGSHNALDPNANTVMIRVVMEGDIFKEYVLVKDEETEQMEEYDNVSEAISKIGFEALVPGQKVTFRDATWGLNLLPLTRFNFRADLPYFNPLIPRKYIGFGLVALGVFLATRKGKSKIPGVLVGGAGAWILIDESREK